MVSVMPRLTMHEIRKRGHEALSQLEKDVHNNTVAHHFMHLHWLFEETRRIRTKRPEARKRYGPISPHKVLEVREYMARHPSANHADVAQLLKLGNSRAVSYIMSGHRGKPVYDIFGNKVSN